jgi:hypothetical protein
MSRHLAEAASTSVFVHLAQDVIEPSGGDITLHLSVSPIVSPPVKPGRQLGALLERQLLDR